MFKSKKKQFTVTPKDPEYTVHYLGSLRTILSKGEGCCEEPLEKIWRKSSSGTKTVRAKLSINPIGLKLIRLDPPLNPSSSKAQRNYGEQNFSVKRISYCASGKRLKSVFAWIYRHELRKMAVELRVHAIVCGSSDAAENIATEVWQRFQFSFKDYKLERKSSDRILERRESAEEDLKEALPNVPLRKKLQAKSSYAEKEALGQRKSLASIREGSNEEDDDEEGLDEHIDTTLVNGSNEFVSAESLSCD